MKDPKRQPFWEKVKATFNVLADETARAAETVKAQEEARPTPPPPAAPAPRKHLKPTRSVSSTPGVEEDKLIKGGLRLRRGRYATCPLPPVDYQTGDLLEPPPEPRPAPAPEAVDPYALADASEEARSPHRLDLIEAYDCGRFPLPQMRDPQYMYRLITEEREFQTAALKACRREYLLARGEGSADVIALEAQLKRHGMIIQHLYKVLKTITGKEGPTGGTGFI